MKKLLTSIFAALTICVLPLSAYEWGGIVKEDASFALPDITKISDPTTFDISQSNSLFMWVNTNLGEEANWHFSTEGLYKYKLFFDNAKLSYFTNIVDLDLLKFNGQYNTANGIMNIALGRFFVVDNSATIFAQTCDGISFKYSFPVMNISTYAGFTGLLNALNVTMLDETSYAAAKTQNAQVYSLSHSYIPLIAAFDIPFSENTQTVAVQASAFLDMNKETRYDRYYAGVNFKGPIIGSIFYSVNTTFGFAKAGDEFKGISNYSDFTVSSYAGSSLAIYAGIKYASGNNGFFKAFRGFSSNPAYSGLSQPELSGVMIPNIKVIIAAKKTNIALNAKMVFTCPTDTFNFNGIEGNASVLVNIFSDLQLSFGLQAYYDLQANDITTESGEVIKNTGDTNYKASLGIVFAF